MTRDEIVAGLLVTAFAVFVTAHVALVFGLARTPPRWRAAVALVVPPLAPYWGWQRLRRRAIVWVAAALAYTVLLLAASR